MVVTNMKAKTNTFHIWTSIQFVCAHGRFSYGASSERIRSKRLQWVKSLTKNLQTIQI